MNYIEAFIKSINRKQPNAMLKKPVKDAEFQSSIYTGKNQDAILHEYRKRESNDQKAQRSRITISRTKHTARQIENVINQLDTMDKPAINVIHPNENIQDSLLSWIYNNNISSLAFDFVKYYNIVDANAFIIGGVNEFEELEFKAYPVSCVYDFHVVNKSLKYVMFTSKRTYDKQEVTDYMAYTSDGIYKFVDKKGAATVYDLTDAQDIEGFYLLYEETKMNFAFPVGFIRDSTSDFKTYNSLLDPASELFKSLIWQGSELDTTKATHGIIQKYAYAKPCGYEIQTETQHQLCNGGYLDIDGNPSGIKCNACKGSGLNIHTSSQDIIMFPFPTDPSNTMKLSDLTHTVEVPTGFLDFQKQEIEDLKDEIMRTVFNATTVTKDEIAATATEKVIDLQGIYSTLNQVGAQTSELFIWMCEVKCAVEGIEGAEFLHGYTLNLKLESVETLADKRKKMIDSGAPNEIIKSIDLAILQKQHIDSPQAIDRFSIWERYRPFSDKSDSATMQIVSSLPNTNGYKILYNFFGSIKTNIMSQYGADFFDFAHERRQQIIDEEVAKIRETLIESEQLNRPNITNF